MPQTPHVEKHFQAGAIVRDIVIGMSDGLTVPFALAAGISGSIAAAGIVNGNALVVTAGLAEVAAGAIAMGLGGYLAARGDAEHYAHEYAREQREIVEKPQAERDEVSAVLRQYGLSDEQISPILAVFEKNSAAWLEFMMRFELGLEKPQPHRAILSALTIAGAYVAGGLVPLVPYMALDQPQTALAFSVAVTLLALFCFGWSKGLFTGKKPWLAALQTTFVGGLAAAAAFAIAKLVSEH